MINYNRKGINQYGEAGWASLTKAQKNTWIRQFKKDVRLGKKLRKETQHNKKVKQHATKLLQRERKQQQETHRLNRNTEYLKAKKSHIVAKRELRAEHPIVKIFSLNQHGLNH